VPAHLKNKVEQALLAAHPYEEVAFDWLSLGNTEQRNRGRLGGRFAQRNE